MYTVMSISVKLLILESESGQLKYIQNEVDSSVSFYQYIRLRCEVRNGNVLNVEYKCHTVLG